MRFLLVLQILKRKVTCVIVSSFICTQVFGLPLYECMRSEEDGTLQLPPFVVQCVAFFRERKTPYFLGFEFHDKLFIGYLKEQGLFRVPGATAEVAALRETFDRGVHSLTVFRDLSDDKEK
jgi:hypothetical protein